MDALTTALQLIERNGLAVVGLVAFGAVIVFLFRDNRATVKAAHAVEVGLVKEQRDEERKRADAAETRLASNAEVLKEATGGFAAALALMERMADPDAKRK